PAPRACLEGIRVLDLASFIAGPFCPMLLADLGAEVLKIEAADGDPFRMAAFGFVGWNRGKRSMVLDLKRAEGREVFLDLARRADVVVDNFRAGVMERLGLGWETLHDVNAPLVHTSTTGSGPSGPPPPAGGRDFLGPLACRRLYACADGWVCVAASAEAHAAALGRLAGVPLALDDPAEGAAAAAVTRALGALSRAEALARLAGAGVPAAPCLDFQELFTDPLLRAAGCVAEPSHPALGPLRTSGAFIDFEATPAVLRRSAPLLGADGPAALGELGYPAERLAAL